MTHTAISRSDAQNIYNALISAPVDKWKAQDAVVGAFGPGTEGEAKLRAVWGDKGDAGTLSLGLSMMSRAAHANDFDSFYDSVKDGELPPFNLSPAEMEDVKGGLIALMFLLDVAIYTYVWANVL